MLKARRDRNRTLLNPGSSILFFSYHAVHVFSRGNESSCFRAFAKLV